MEYKCEECDHQQQLGEEVIAVQRGVVGQRGFVPFEDDMMYFCNEQCLVRFFDEKPAVHRTQRRIP